MFGPRNTALIVAIIEAIVVIGLFYGFYLMRVKRDRKAHEKNQIIFVIVNLLLITAMAMGFYRYVVGDSARSPLLRQIMIGHAIMGTVIQLLGIYLVFRMKNWVPQFLRIKKYKLLMQITLGLWTLQALGGFFIYYEQYYASAAEGEPSPVAWLQFRANDLSIHSDEMLSAAQNGNLPSAKRHAEHAVNLIVGKTSADYGDLDRNGFVEDPGDGIGLVTRLRTVRDIAAQMGGSGAQATQVADQVQATLIKIVASTKTILAVKDANGLIAAQPQLAEIAKLSGQINTGQEDSIPQIATLMGENTIMPAVQAEPSEPGTVTVNLKDFEFVPKELTVKKGTVVTFVNQDRAKHTVTADDRKFASGDLPSGKSFTMTFNDPGTFPYYCEFHGDKGGVDMSGKITVQP
jgi:plastocyanin